MAVKHLQSHPFFAVFLPCINLLLFLQTATAQPAERMWADTVLAETLLDTSRQLHREDDHARALEKAGQALDIYTGLYGDSHTKTSKARMHFARELRCADRVPESADLFEQCLRLYETTGDTFRMALCHYHIGLCWQNLGSYPEAMLHLRTAITLLHRDSVGRSSYVADFEVAVGSVYISEKNYLAAIPSLEKSKDFYTRVGQQHSLGLVSYHLGGAYYGLNDFVRAKEHYLTAMANLKPVLKPAHTYFADLYVKIGFCYQKTGEPATGLSLMEEAKAAYLKAGTEDLKYIAFLQRMGQFYLAEGQYAAAIEQIQLCLTAKEKCHGKLSPRLMSTLQDLGEACLRAGQFDRAEACLRRGLQIIADSLSSNSASTARYYTGLAALRFEQGDYAGSLLWCDSAFAVAGFDPAHPEKMLPRDHFRELCQRYAQSLFRQFQRTADTALLTHAERYFSIAGETLYREVEEISVNSSREILFDRDYPVLEQWLDVRMALYAATGNAQHLEAAFQIAAKSKAFLLSEAMRRSGALRYAGAPDSIFQAELNLRERIVSAEKILETSGYSSSMQIDSAILALYKQLSYWREDYDALLRRIAQDYPEYFRMRLLQRDIPTGELRRKWLAPDQALLMYSQTGAHLYLFVLTRDTFCVKSLPPDLALNGEIENFRNSLTEYFTAADPDDVLYDLSLEKYVALAQLLYGKLVLPVAALLPERVIIIPDGKLCYLPFEALLTGAPKDAGNFRSYPFWAREKALSYALSTDFLVETRKPPARKPEKNWLGIAPFAPETGTDSGMIARASSADSGFPLLSFSGQEVNNIAAMLQGETWLNTATRPGRFQEAAFRYRILHLATHSRADDRMGHYSYLVTSMSGERLPAKDLYQMSLAAEMVVLSACEAGGGELLRGEGIIGLVRAFTYAGARSIVASLWLASDQSTANLMLDFYRRLLQGTPRDVALKAARINTINQSPAAAHPFFWAGFRVYGNTKSLF